VEINKDSAMTIIASLLFLTALVASIGVITLSIRNAMPRIQEVIDMEFAPAMQRERRIILGDMRRLAPATIIAFPSTTRVQNGSRLAA
jgi:hypothetical protein